MSANIYYRPTKETGFQLSVDAPSTFMENIRKAFLSEFPLIFGQDSVQTLKGMAAMHHGEENPYDELIEAIEKHETIEVYAKY